MKNVTSPPRISRETVDPRSVIPKYASIAPIGLPASRLLGEALGDLVTMAAS